MCVLAFAWRAHPDWLLVVAGNRDELHARPAKYLSRWDVPDHLLAGRDLHSGGTWLGVSEQGRFAVVTNLRGYGAPEAHRPSRGALVKDVLSGEGHYADVREARLSDFNPFNLITADADRAYFLSNRPTIDQRLLGPGVYGLSNGGMDEPWPKTVRLKEMMVDWLSSEGSDPRILLDDLREEELPRGGMSTAGPSDVPQEPPLSSIFIRNPVYGTRCSTIVAIGKEGRGTIIERSYDASGQEENETGIDFSWPA